MKQEGWSKSTFSLNSPSKTQSSSRNIFDPLRHQKPKFEANGTEIDWFYSLDAQNILTHKENIRIPSNWKNSANTARTYTELAWNRRKANLPDKSFDWGKVTILIDFYLKKINNLMCLIYFFIEGINQNTQIKFKILNDIHIFKFLLIVNFYFKIKILNLILMEMAQFHLKNMLFQRCLTLI